MSRRRVGRYAVEITHGERVLFPRDGITKADLAEYYAAVAPAMLPHLAGRPLSLQRFPAGIDGEGFFQKEAPDSFPAWIARATVEKEGGEITHALAANAATLVYLANQGSITPHVWLSRVDRPRQPDQLIFDLDPAGDDFAPVRRAAFAARELLAALGLLPYVKTTGSRGVHLVVPLVRREDFDAVRGFAHAVAERLVAQHPEALTVEPRKAARGGRLFVDTLRNGYAQTAVAPYAVRARDGAPVATPITWEELADPAVGPRSFTLAEVPGRLRRQGDPWREMRRHARSLGPARRKLAKL